MARPLYRSRQVLHALRPRIEQPNLDAARGVLNEGESRLFFAMQPADQRHALEVYTRLRGRVDDRDLLAAALLHDCGKGEMPLALRILNVLSPRLVARLADRRGEGWRGAAYRLRHHAELGAQQAQAAGSTPRTVRLIQGHTEPEEAWMHDLLRSADDAS